MTSLPLHYPAVLSLIKSLNFCEVNIGIVEVARNSVTGNANLMAVIFSSFPSVVSIKVKGSATCWSGARLSFYPGRQRRRQGRNVAMPRRGSACHHDDNQFVASAAGARSGAGEGRAGGRVVGG